MGLLFRLLPQRLQSNPFALADLPPGLLDSLEQLGVTSEYRLLCSLDLCNPCNPWLKNGQTMGHLIRAALSDMETGGAMSF